MTTFSAGRVMTGSFRKRWRIERPAGDGGTSRMASGVRAPSAGLSREHRAIRPPGGMLPCRFVGRRRNRKSPAFIIPVTSGRLGAPLRRNGTTPSRAGALRTLRRCFGYGRMRRRPWSCPHLTKALLQPSAPRPQTRMWSFELYHPQGWATEGPGVRASAFAPPPCRPVRGAEAQARRAFLAESTRQRT